jgi:hypothetical protein
MAIIGYDWQKLREYRIADLQMRVDKLLAHAFLMWRQDDRRYYYALQREAGMDIPGSLYLDVLRAKLYEVSNGDI